MGKIKIYNKVIKTLRSVFDTKLSLSFQAKMSISSAVIYSEFSNLIFCGFYILDSRGHLEIGPYQGNVLACTTIKIGKGVCGTVAKNEKTIIVDDVRKYDNYITCDPETRSEIVVPVFENGKLKAVIDIDSAKIGYFDQIDFRYLNKISKIII